MMRYKTWVKAGIVGMAVASLSGCASWFSEQKSLNEIEQRQNEVLETLEKEPEKRSRAREFVSSTPWIAGQSVHKEQAYPRLESTPALLTEKSITLPRVAARLGDLTGINISLDPDLGQQPTDDDFQSDQQGQQSTGAAGGSAPPNPLAPQLGRNQRNEKLTGLVMEPLTSEIDVEFDTSLKRALDSIASRFSIDWVYDRQANEVTFYRTRTETLQIDYPGAVTGEIQVGSNDDQDSVMSEEITYQNSAGSWSEIKRGLDTLLSPWGKAEISESTGAISITDTPDTLEAAKEYVSRLNETFSRQVYLEFRMVSVIMEDGNSFQASWDGVLNQILDGDYAAGLTTGSGVMSSQGNTLNVIRNENQAQAALQMLAEKANLSQVTSRSVTTMSNQPAPIRVVSDQTYVSGVNELQNTGSDAGVTTEVETDTINTGFSATLLPRIQGSERLQLQISIELSSLVSLETIEDSLIQVPELDRQTTVQRAWLKSGETLVMSGFSQNEDQLDLSGSGDAGFWGFGGGRSRQSNEQVLLIMVTPHVRSGDHLG